MFSKRMKLVVFSIFVLACQSAWSDLPQGPDSSHVRQVVERLRMEARASTTQESREHIEHFLRDQPGDNAVLYNNAGVILLLQYHPFEALWSLTKAVQQDPDSAQAMNNLSVLLTNMQRYNEAEQILLYIVNRWPGSSTPLLNLGRIYTDQRRLDLAEQCVNSAFKADPGRPDTEKLGARISIMRRDSQSAAGHIVNLEVLDPGNPDLDIYKENIPQAELIAERLQRIQNTPMPLRYTELQDIETELDVFVINETETRYWDSLAQRINIAATPIYENFEMTPEIWKQIPPEMQSTLEQLGAGPGTTQATMAPAVSRSQYLILADVIQAYEQSFIDKIELAYNTPDLLRLLEDEGARQRRFREEYERTARRSGDPTGAMKRWLSKAVTSLEETHPVFRGTILNTREAANALTMRYWGTAAALIAIVPEEFREKERDSLNRTVSLSNLTYAKFISQWYGLAKLPVLLDKEDARITTEQLHEAAAERARQLEDLTEDRQQQLDLARWEEIMNEPVGYTFELPEGFDPHAGPCVEVVCLQFHFGDRSNPWTLRKIVLSGSTPTLGPRAATTLDLRNRELIIAQGLHYSPSIGALGVGAGASDKWMAGLVLGGENVVDVRLMHETSIDISTPIGGLDIPLSEQNISLTDVARATF